MADRTLESFEPAVRAAIEQRAAALAAMYGCSLEEALAKVLASLKTATPDASHGAGH